MGKRKHEGEPWIENCTPHSIDDLAVQKKKVSEVQQWIENSFKLKTIAPILLLTGPPGAGKTATVILLCSTLKAEILLWKNLETDPYQNVNGDFPDNSERRWVKKENQASQFSNFLLRGNKYCLYSDEKKVILIEEFPNAFLRDPSSFHQILRKYKINGRHPLILIISDNTRGQSVESRLFPPDLKSSLKVSNISFNPIAQTKLLKALNRINDAIQFQSCYRRLTKPQLEDIATNSMGDIRNAINSLQFLSISSFKRPRPVGKVKGNSTSIKEKSQETSRDSSLFLFHALGKILYCKRDKSVKGDKDVLPIHMRNLERDPALANAEEVFEKTSLSSEAFSLFLHENFLSFMSNINEVADALCWFSESDLFTSYWSAQDSLSNYTASLASRGLMFNMVTTTGNSWKPLNKPYYYDCAKKQASRMSSLKTSFRDMSVSQRVLQTELLPYLQKIRLDLRPDQSALVAEIGEMKVKSALRLEYHALKEKEFPDLLLEDFDQISDLNTEKTDSLDVVEGIDDEVIIEEYDF